VTIGNMAVSDATIAIVMTGNVTNNNVTNASLRT
jgi:hypothetical protein